MEVEGNERKQWRSQVLLAGRVLTAPGGLPRLPQLPRHPYVASFTCLLSETVHSARGCPAGVTASSLCVYLILLVGG